ncbi:ribosome-associated translation inhibitor RaiA [Saccharomonospora amisosensis]|uniref:Ribosome-associated translation inhibitor RaiA n=1 Tax=Saccharomonospora amisosensis TaxID=1128677 RepID=A0A7X5ZQN3_9PSEU|nr:hypothetical protein [Saccharomonospora amisosensis]NIJ12023.1 ribosome-associated translation inhibitor RaiA [Saccharomonospora amisosensis]
MTPTSRHEQPAVHVSTHGRVDPAVVGYTLDRLRGLGSDYPVDAVQVELARQGRGMRIELTAVLAGRQVRAVHTGDSPRSAIDHAHNEFVRQVELAGRWTRLLRSEHGIR